MSPGTIQLFRIPVESSKLFSIKTTVTTITSFIMHSHEECTSCSFLFCLFEPSWHQFTLHRTHPTVKITSIVNGKNKVSFLESF